jgi:REP element-mobilizing transposase RayT
MFHRKNNRLGNKELYQKNNWYFITLVEASRKCIFSSISRTEVACNSPKIFESCSGIVHNPFLNIEQNSISNYNVETQPNTGKIEQAPDYELQVTPLLSEIGKVIESNWFYLETLFSDISLKDFVIMPNHIHFILELGNNPSWKNLQKPTDLGNIIKALKSKSVVDSKKLGIFHDSTFWQRSYYDHIIRDESELLRIREYIRDNPKQWELDILNPINERKYKEKFSKH